jgi:hypothetical protein
MTEQYEIKVGDRIEGIAAYNKGQRGSVTLVIPCDPDDPIEKHGFIDVHFDNDEEDIYVHWDWSRFLKILPV